MDYYSIPIQNILFLDIETVPQCANYDQVADDMKPLWDKKAMQIRKNDEEPADIYQQAGIYAEFGRIVCISVGFIREENGIKTFFSKSFADHDERKLLVDFKKLIDQNYSVSGRYICGHNVKEFDMPYIARRMVINGLQLPIPLQIAGKKPWEVQFIDTLEMWKFGDYKAYTSLNLLTHVLGIPTPKDDIDGSQVATVYYEENDLKRISVYCEKDILATAQVFLKMTGHDIIDQEHNVVHKD